MDIKKFDEYRLMWKFMVVARKHRNAVESGMADIPIHGSQHHLLGVLAASGGDVSQKEIAKILKISPAAVAVSLKKLENGGYIKRETSEEDGRFNKTVITKEGLDVLERGKKVFSEVDRQSLKGFSAEEKKILDSYIMRISDNLSELLGKDYDI